MSQLNIVLGSSSQWRRKVLAEMLDILPEKVQVLIPNIDEKKIRHDDPKEMTLQIARAKSQALLSSLSEPCILICSDQVAVYNGEVREKPIDSLEARKFLESYRDHPVQVVVSLVVTNTKTGKTFEGVAMATQKFKYLPDSFIDYLLEQGDVFNACGGFVIEHMQEYIDKLEGEMETVQGLPKTLTLELLSKAQNS
ncbi:7-methyl-GTP pyrophosphatase-like isoform X2 [Schistocerca gregaria]|uniref:7-methyl-GTP pyrophosphatase-like isoform X2 n=1 Tax=Schistocerca gregaria TaxID=7010 RepID=UPI00211E5CD4|nr:7-methyl-GTP pyrophosphatase-like isoform X2 [Schistocerca gregaria]